MASTKRETPYFKLLPDKRTAVPCTMEEWSRNKVDRRLKVTNFGVWKPRSEVDPKAPFSKACRDCIVVSTVFLGIDHGWSSQFPVLWETLVFHGPLDGEMNRYTSAEAALIGHDRMVERVDKALQEERCS